MPLRNANIFKISTCNFFIKESLNINKKCTIIVIVVVVVVVLILRSFKITGPIELHVSDKVQLSGFSSQLHY